MGPDGLADARRARAFRRDGDRDRPSRRGRLDRAGDRRLDGPLAFLGGTWFPITGSGTLHDIAQALPSYWLVQAGHVALGGSGWSERGWIVVAAWTAVMLVVAARADRRDTERN